MKLKCLASLLFLTTTIISCAQNNSNNAAIELTISTKAFSAGVTQPGAQILDVRTAGEYQSGHIANALQANWLDPKEFKNRTQHLDKSKMIYIYCQSGGRSASRWSAGPQRCQSGRIPVLGHHSMRPSVVRAKAAVQSHSETSFQVGMVSHSQGSSNVMAS